MVYREAGAGPAVLVIPGLGLSGRFYDRSCRDFAAAGLRLVVPDLPGFGGTRGAGTGLEVEPTCAVLLQLADELRIERAVWLGHSLGTHVALRLAATEPGRTSGVVLAGPTRALGPAGLARQAWSLVREALRAPVPVVLHVLSDYLRTSPFSYLGTWLRYGRDRPLEWLPDISCPVLLVLGTRDPVADASFIAALRRGLPQARTEIVGGGTHTLPRAKAAAFNAAVLSFCLDANAMAR